MKKLSAIFSVPCLYHKHPERVSLPSPSPLFFRALSDEPTPAICSTLFFKLHAFLNRQTNDPSIPHLPQVYNTYLVVKFTSGWTQYSSYENKANISLLLQQVMENTSSLQHMIKIRPNTIVSLTRDGNMTSISQFIMQHK